MNNTYYFLRHGQTIYQKEGRKTNYKPDSPQKLEITEEGRQMVKKSAEELKDKNIDIIFASPYLRTRQSAEIAAEVLGKKYVTYDDRIVDINLGIFMGRPSQESDVFYKQGAAKFNNKPEGGESWGDILDRIKSFLDELEEKYKDKNILIISHADPIWEMLGYLRRYDSEEQFIEARKDRDGSYPCPGQLIKA